jgi:hypothetical protein
LIKALVKKYGYDLCYYAFAVAMSSVSAYLIYQTIYMFRASLAAVVGGLLLGSLLWTKKFKASIPVAILGGLLGYIVFGTLGFVKFQAATPADLLVIIAKQIFYVPIYSWKQLSTLDIPVGSFSTTLAPYFMLIFAVTYVCAYMHKRGKGVIALDVFFSFVLLLFGFAFGFKEHSATIVIFGAYFPRLRDILIGIVWLVGTLIWLNLRSRKVVGGIVVDKVVSDSKTGGFLTRKLKTGVLLAVVLSIACTFAVHFSVPFSGNNYKNLRESPLEQAPPQTSPLDNFRSYFKAGEGGALDEPLLQVSGDIPDNKRLRFAVLPFYDGVKSLANNSESAAVDLYYQLVYKFNHFEASHTSEITNFNYQTPWLPTLGIPVNVEFQGQDSLLLQQSLFFNTNTSSMFLDEAGVKIDKRNSYTNAINFPLSAKYKIFWRDRWDNDDSEASADGESKYTSKDKTPALYQWIQDNNHLAPSNTVGDVKKLVEEMMYYSYLSRSLDDPKTVGDAKTWLPNEDYTFAPSYSGQSIKRIDSEFFGELNKTNAECSRSDTSSNCGILVGDEQQFAAAAMLIADMKGFDTRVVVGAKIEDDGIVYGRDLTVWTEVKNSIQHNWARIYVEPRTDNHVPIEAPLPKLNTYTTDVQYSPTQTPELSESKAQSSTRGSAASRANDAVRATFSFIFVFRGLFIAVILALVALPTLVILLAKRTRRRSRRRIFNAESQIAAGWRELQDFMADHGVPYPAKSVSRSGYADQVASEIANGVSEEGVSEKSYEEVMNLAHIADRAVFGELSPNDTVVNAFWQSLERVQNAKKKSEKPLKRVLSALSLRSLSRRRR